MRSSTCGVLAALVAAWSGLCLPASAADDLIFRDLFPCRLIDTRDGSGASTSDNPPGTLANPGPHHFRLQGFCGVPNDAKAVTVNFLVIGPSQGGHLVAYPFGGTAPIVSVMTFAAGVILANGATVPLSPVAAPADEDLTVLIGMVGSGALHLVIDVTGYHVKAPPTGASFFGRFGGDGSDGVLTVKAGDTVTAPQRAEYTSLTIDAAGTLLGAAGGHTMLGVKGRCTIAGTVDADGVGMPGGPQMTGFGVPSRSGTNAVGEVDFFDGDFRSAVPFCFTGAGGGGGGTLIGGGVGGHGGGGAVSGGSGGSGGNPGNSGGSPPGLWFAALGAGLVAGSGETLTDVFTPLLQCYGAGGGGGAVSGSSGSHVSGAGGRGGGVVYLECGELELSGTLSARGGAGADATAVQAGGGGGGGGGVIFVRTKEIIANSGAVDVQGGPPGVGIGSGFAGGAGGQGYWDIVVIP